MIKKIALTISCVMIIITAFAQTAAQLVSEGQQYEQQKNEAAALDKYKDAIKIAPTNIPALCRASILSTREAMRQNSQKVKEGYLKVAQIYANAALQHAPDSPEANYVAGLAMDGLASIAGAKEKVEDYKDVYKYVNTALQIDSAYALAWHLAGKLNYELTNLNMVERAAANVLFGGVPKASLQTAIEDYEKCLQLDRSFILNYYDLAIAYHDDGHDDKAIAILKRAMALRSILQDDDQYKAKCKTMLESLE
jgi:tetratricopeptide (TPR) repeat protein